MKVYTVDYIWNVPDDEFEGDEKFILQSEVEAAMALKDEEIRLLRKQRNKFFDEAANVRCWDEDTEASEKASLEAEIKKAIEKMESVK